MVKNVWEAVPCATKEYMKTHLVARPVVANSIWSTPHRGPEVMTRPPFFTTVTTPFDWGSIEITQTTANIAAATEVDNVNGPNAFTVQNNTNSFVCTTCSAGKPFSSASGIANSASAAGDYGWVQFVYTQFGAGPANKGLSNLCVWNVDASVSGRTNGKAGYASNCVYPSLYGSVAPIEGKGAPTGAVEVTGYVQCPSAGPPCTLWAIAQIPWSPDSSWWSVSAPDMMGLSGNWINVGGGILGVGNGSEAVFTNAQFQSVVRAYTCYVSPIPSNNGAPTSCANPPPYETFSLYFRLTAGASDYFPTAETNNLVNNPVTLSCGDYDCWMTYNSSAP